MSEIEHNAFEEHCKASETYDIMDNGEYISTSSNTKECYACATQRHSCEHDGQDDSEDLPEWWNEV